MSKSSVLTVGTFTLIKNRCKGTTFFLYMQVFYEKKFFC